MKKILLTALFVFPVLNFAQGYTSYFTGNPVNITTTTSPGVCLMGGATEHDNAMIWLMQKANGGDIVVLRSSGSDGYNDYMYSELGLTVNSVETLVITSVAGATNPYVLNKVANAEMIWFAGGDQYDYVSYFKDNALEDLINAHINIKHAPIGGTSAGMAILGGHYFSAQNGSITSAQALGNPYHNYMTLGSGDFVNIPILHNVITDTHFDNPNRKGRMATFLARIATDEGSRSYGIACNEYVAVCIDEDGKATVYGDYPNYQEFAYFLQSNCQDDFAPETCQANTALTWNRAGEAIKVYKVPGTMTGVNSFSLSDWQTGTGGSWQHWKAINGTFSETVGTMAECSLGIDDLTAADIHIYPVPFSDQLHLNGMQQGCFTISDAMGKKVFEGTLQQDQLIDTSMLSAGLYVISLENNGKRYSRKVIKN